MLRIDQKIIIVTRDTQLGALKRRHSTRMQAKFQMVSSRKRELAVRSKSAKDDAAIEMLAEQEFDELDRAAEQYESSVRQLHGDLDFDDFDLPVQKVDRSFLPNFVFGPNDVVVTVGQDGLVANTAKYALGLPIVAVNPDPARIDGVLLPFRTDQARAAVRAVLSGRARYREVTLAEARLADGQRLLAFNELFIGCRSHVSARYRLTVGGRTEPQSSSGVLVATGAGSTGWLSSVFNMAAGVASAFGRVPAPAPVRMKWEDPRLVYVVREPFVSKSSAATLVAGLVGAGDDVAFESDMPADGVIFSDGVEADFLEFNAGAVARVAPAKQRARLVVP